MNYIHETELETQLKVKRYKNTTVYLNEDIAILSPYVDNKYHWFDLRQVNFDRINDKSRKWLIIRDTKFGLIICDLNGLINTMIKESNKVITEKAGVHWKFIIEKNGRDEYKIVNQHDHEIYICDFYDLARILDQE